jgi:hypothetical protein
VAGEAHQLGLGFFFCEQLGLVLDDVLFLLLLFKKKTAFCKTKLGYLLCSRLEGKEGQSLAAYISPCGPAQ